MAKEPKGQFGALFLKDLPGVDILPAETAPSEPEQAAVPTPMPPRVKPLAKSKDPEWMKTGILIRKTTNVKLRQYLLNAGMAAEGPQDDMSELVDRVLREWVDRQMSSQTDDG